MRYWKGIVYGITAVLAMWRLSKTSVLPIMNDSSAWHGGVHKLKAALVLANGMNGWVYGVRDFKVAHATSVTSFVYYLQGLIPSSLLDHFTHSGVLFSITEVTTNNDEVAEMVNAYGDGTTFLASLTETDRKAVLALGKAFDELPSHIELPIRFTLFRRGR